MDIVAFIFISIMALALGYASANTQNFNFWKLLFFALFLLPVILIFGMSKYHAIVVLVFFALGFVLPYAYSLKFIGNSVSSLVNAIRYRDDYESIKRQKEELENLRKSFEEAKKAYQRTEEEFKKRAKQGKSGSSNNGSNSSNNKSKWQNNNSEQSQKQTNRDNKSREYYFKILGLDPNKECTLADIRKAYKRMQMKYHADRHPNATREERREFDKKLIEFKRAFEWLEKNV